MKTFLQTPERRPSVKTRDRTPVSWKEILSLGTWHIWLHIQYILVKYTESERQRGRGLKERVGGGGAGGVILLAATTAWWEIKICVTQPTGKHFFMSNTSTTWHSYPPVCVCVCVQKIWWAFQALCFFLLLFKGMLFFTRTTSTLEKHLFPLTSSDNSVITDYISVRERLNWLNIYIYTYLFYFTQLWCER